MTSFEQGRGTTADQRRGITDQRWVAEVWTPHYVYRCFDDTGRLIYVGCSTKPTQRVAQHRTAAWWGHQIANMRCLVFPDRLYALERERQAIAEENPRWNTKGRWQHRSLWSANDYSDYFLAVSMGTSSSSSYNTAHLDRVAREARQRYGLLLGGAAA